MLRFPSRASDEPADDTCFLEHQTT